ncbi:MAG: c-type cytochrome [Flavobacteriales bacterium]|nr:c-type cytochrome [Flavobacteriales bacterium]
MTERSTCNVVLKKCRATAVRFSGHLCGISRPSTPILSLRFFASWRLCGYSFISAFQRSPFSRTKPVLAAVLLFVLIAATTQHPEPVQLKIPAGWPAPTYDFSKNPLTKEGIALGRKLFYDPILSVDSIVSCSSCHLSYTAFTHVDHAVSHGIRDRIGTRNSPALMNLAWSGLLMWDGAVNHLDVQALAPIAHPDEMGEDIAHVVEKLRRSGRYPGLFYDAFGDATITGERMLKALSQFELTLISANSKYDRAQAGLETFTDQEASGYRIFKAHCIACHRPPLFTTGAFANNGLAVDTVYHDLGRMKITGDPTDSLKFKIPTLRNVEFSFPYMHDGRFKSLRQVIDHYAEGLVQGRTLAPELRDGVTLSKNERTDLVAFLLTLSDREFCFNPDHAFPRE